MQFFDQKEDVLDIVLTKKGKQLLSQGKFRPYGYKFFDNKTVYEASNGEEQNATINRIKTTPYPKQEIPEPLYTVGNPDKKIDINISAPFGFVNNPQLHNELGKSDQFTEYSPSWNIQFLESSGAYASAYLSSDINGKTKIEEQIPQFNINANYKVALVYAYYDEKQGKYLYDEKYKDKFNRVQLIVQRDTDDVFVKALENNSFTETERQHLTLELYKYINTSGFLQELKSINMNQEEEDSYSNYFTILFDDVAEESNAYNTKNIYKEETEDVC
jgi:hypothetical protein